MRRECSNRIQTTRLCTTIPTELAGIIIFCTIITHHCFQSFCLSINHQFNKRELFRQGKYGYFLFIDYECCLCDLASVNSGGLMSKTYTVNERFKNMLRDNETSKP